MTIRSCNNKKPRRRFKKALPPPAYLATMGSSVATVHGPKSPFSEAYRGIRTNFFFSTIDSRPKKVMITSAVSAEGKTTTSANFAIVLAENGARVLLIDADLRIQTTLALKIRF